MSGSTVLNQRQDGGLQQLILLGSVARSFLGPNKNYKFIQDETSGESSLVCSCLRLLENFELTGTVGQLVSEAVQAHHKVYHCGSGCLVFVAGAWSRAALECLQKGLSVSHIISAMSEGMDICLDVCMKNSISIDNLGTAVSENCPAVPGFQLSLPKTAIVGPSPLLSHLHGTTQVVHKTRNNCGQRKIKLTHSRHFCEVESDNVSTILSPHSPDSKHVDIASIAEAVSHGCVDAMNLVLKASQLQSKISVQDGSCTTFDVSKVVTCVLPGLSEDNACVLPGCVVLLSAEQASIALHLKGQHLQVALINGDLCNRYRHLGFNKPTAVRYMTDKLDSSSVSKEEEWIENVLKTLLNMNVNLILVSGVANEKLAQHCLGRHLLVVEKIKPSVLKAFADATGAVPVTYATQLNQHCVGTGVHVAIWRDLSSSERRSCMAVNIATNKNTGLVTVILTSSVHSKLQALEDRFWSCAYRLHHALKDRALLPGAGWIEMLCIHHLQKHVEDHAKLSKEESEKNEAGGAGNPYRDVVLLLMADGLMDYITTVIVNSRGCSKVKAWTATSQRLKDLNGGLCIDATFSELPTGDETEESINSSDMKCSKASSKTVCDNLNVKLEAWRRALDVVLLVLQTDAEIITGIDPEAVGTRAHVSLL